MHRRSLIELLAGYSQHGSDTACSQRDGYRMTKFSYRELAALAAQVARELEARGIAPGDRVLLWGRNSGEWVAAFWGCVLRGVVAVPMDRAATPEFAGRVVQDTGAKLFVVGREHVKDCRSIPALILDTLPESVTVHSHLPYALPPLDRRSPAEILFTSGTTAEPHGVVLTHGNILANLEPLERAIRPYLKWERIFHPLRFLNLVPLSHVFGQFMGVWVPPLLGAAVLFQDSLNPAEIMATIRHERVWVLVAVPRILEALQHKIERDMEAEGCLEDFRRELQAAENDKFLRRMWKFRRIHHRFGWRFIAVISGGAILDADTEQFWNRLGYAAIQGYGLTETTSLVSVNHPFRIGRGSIGKVLEGHEVKLAPDGEILVRGENVASAYWKGGELRQAMEPPGADSDQGGWFRTGDLGELDAEGNLYFKGRKKEVIVTSAGMNVYPQDLEVALRRQPEVEDCVVLELDHGENAEACAVLLLRNGNADPAQIVARANSSLADYQRMRQWFVWPEADFPRTSTGKPKLADIRTALTPETTRAATIAGADRGIAGLIARLQGTKKTGVSADSRLESDLDLSSLDRVELLGAIEDRYQVGLNETQFTAAKTVGELERLVRESSPETPDFVFPRWAQRWPVAWARVFVYYLLTWPATHLLAHPRVFGRENLRGVKGPVLVISNHVIYLDVGFVLAALPRRLRHRLAVAMGGERLASMRRPPRNWPFPRRWLQRMNYFLVVSLFNVFPLPKRSGFRESFRFAGDLADRGWNVLVFPEGELTPDGKLQAFRAGIGLLAANLRIPVVPLRIDGAYEVREEGYVFNRPGRIRVHIGKPVEFPTGSGSEEITRILEQHVASLAHAETSG